MRWGMRKCATMLSAVLKFSFIAVVLLWLSNQDSIKIFRIPYFETIFLDVLKNLHNAYV